MTDLVWQMPRAEEAKPPIMGRMVGAALGLGYAIAFGNSPLTKWLVAGAIVVCSIALILATSRVTTSTIVRLHLSFGLVLEILGAVALPEIWLILCVFAASTITAGVFGQRDPTSLVIGLGGAAAMGALGAYHNVDYWLPVTVVLMFIGPVARSTSQILDVVSDNEAEALSVLSKSVDAVMWEQEVATGRMRTVAGSAESLTGFTASEWAKAEHHDLVHPDDQLGFRSAEFGDSWEGRLKNKNGSWRYVRETFSTFTDPVDETELLRGLTVDLNETIEAKQLADWRANHDLLTRMPNRTLLLSTAEQALGQSKSLVFFVVDIDRFKEVNETLGYSAGDKYLEVIGLRLASLTSETNAFAARIGGDEFAVLVFESMTEDEIEAYAQRLVALCSEPVQISDASVRLSACVGISMSNIDQNLVNLLRRADTAVDQAKKASSTWHIAEEEDVERVSERFHLASQVEEAIRSEQLRLWFQPKIDLESTKIVGFEGLIRWHHPESGLLVPWRFLDVIDISGHADAFDRLVIQQSVQFAAACHRAGHEITVSLNLPGRALSDVGIATFIKNIIDMWSLPASAIIVELTEDAFNEDLKQMIPAMNQIAGIGCGLSIDDFGTGYSSLTRLKELPVTEMKIDRTFVMKLAEDQNSEIIVESTINLARMFGLDCVAEGVEDERAAEILRNHGCLQAQGYLFSKPVSQEDAMALLSADRFGPVLS